MINARQFFPTFVHDWDVFNGGIAQISDTVDADGVPVQAVVYLMDRGAMTPLRRTFSDPVTGAYTFAGLKLGVEFAVMAVDITRTYNIAVKDRVTAALP